MAVPKKKDSSDDDTPPPPAEEKADMPEYSLRVDVPVVTVDARVVQKNGLPMALPPERGQRPLQGLEDGVPQKIQSVTQSEAPITAVLLVEFSATNYNFMYDALNASYAFASNLKPEDWVAVVEFDMKEHILVDFTQDKQAIFGALNTLRIPGFREIESLGCHVRHARPAGPHPGPQGNGRGGQRARHHEPHDLRQDPEEGEGHAQRDHLHHHAPGMRCASWTKRATATIPTSTCQHGYVVADNQMKTFAQLTGGHWYCPAI